MAITWTNTSKTPLILPNDTVVPPGSTVLERNEDSVADCAKNPLVQYLIEVGVLKKTTDSKAPSDLAVIPMFNGGPVPNSANVSARPPVGAPPASDPGPASNPALDPSIGNMNATSPNASAPQVVKSADGTHEVQVGGEVIASGLTKKEATDLAATPSNVKPS